MHFMWNLGAYHLSKKDWPLKWPKERVCRRYQYSSASKIKGLLISRNLHGVILLSFFYTFLNLTNECKLFTYDLRILAYLKVLNNCTSDGVNYFSNSSIKLKLL